MKNFEVKVGDVIKMKLPGEWQVTQMGDEKTFFYGIEIELDFKEHFIVWKGLIPGTLFVDDITEVLGSLEEKLSSKD
jgi:hypothetical protein